MRRVVTGFDSQGRSTVLSDGPVPVAFHTGSVGELKVINGAAAPSPIPDGEAVVFELWNLDAQPRIVDSDPTFGLTVPDFDTPAGQTKWIITHMGPGLDVPMHSTPTVDYGLIVSGEVEIGLDTGPVVLRAGDVVLVNSVMHSWKSGPQGCIIATVQVGLRGEDRQDAR